MLKDILAIAGKPGLYKLLAQGKNNIIVESLENGQRIPIYSSSKVNALEDIAIYTDDEQVELAQVLRAIYKKEEGKATISHKADSKELKALFEEVLPNYDRDQVYVSDMKKVVNWYNILQGKGMISEEEEKEEEKEGQQEDSKENKAETPGNKEDKTT